MSWLPNPFESPQYDAVSNPSHVAGVREDLSVFSQTIGRQLRGVAAFLAPPPSPPSSPSPVAAPSDSSSSASSSPTLRGIRNDLAEIGGSFKSGLKTFSNLFQSQPGDADDECLEDYDGVAGITEEVLHFVSQLSTRPECWTDFPSALDDGDDQFFSLFSLAFSAILNCSSTWEYCDFSFLVVTVETELNWTPIYWHYRKVERSQYRRNGIGFRI